MSKTLQKVVAVTDGEDHWHIIPIDRQQEFFRNSCNEDMCESGEFDSKWSKYRTGGDLNNIQLWAEV